MAGMVLLAFDALLWYLALLLDERALVAGALAGAVVWWFGLVVVCAQYAMMRTAELGAVSDADACATGAAGEWDVTVHAAGVRRLVLPHRVSVTEQVERLDQDGRCIALHVGVPRRGRGWYRHVAHVVVWNDPFGLFHARRLLRNADEFALLPSANGADAGARPADERLRGQAENEHTGGVRDYVPGDPQKFIAWRQSAHRGTLMTRETGLRSESTSIIVLDPIGVDEPIMDALAARAVPLSVAGERAAWAGTEAGAGLNTGSGRRVVVTDGIHIADDDDDIARLLAALMPSVAESGGVRPDGRFLRRAYRRHHGNRHDDGQSGAHQSSTDQSGSWWSDQSHAAGNGKSGVHQSGSQLSDQSHIAGNDQSNTLRSGVHRFGSQWSDRSHAADDGHDAAGRADAVAELSAHAQGMVTVTLLTANPHGPFAQALQPRIAGTRLAVVEITADDTAANHGRTASNPDDTSAAMAGDVYPQSVRTLRIPLRSDHTSANHISADRTTSDRASAALRDSRRAWRSQRHRRPCPVIAHQTSDTADAVRNSSHTEQPTPTVRSQPGTAASATRIDLSDDEPHVRHRVIGQITTAVGLLTVFALTVHAATDIAAPDGWWPWFVGAALAVVAVESSFRWRTPLRGSCRVVVMSLLVALSAMAMVTARIHDAFGVWLFDPDMPAVHLTVGEDAGLVEGSRRIAASTPSRLVVDVLAAGFEGLRAQLPPLDVDAAGDVFLMVLCALIVVLIRCLLYWRAAAPAMALLPVIAFGADYGLVGRTVGWWQITVAVVAFAMLLWSVRPWRALPATAAVSCTVVTALTLALCPAALDMAYAVPLSLGTSGGVFSSTTINPLLDLKRSLDEGSSATVLTYQADRRLYLRMTTLGEFDGDTWRFDEELARDGAFYGSVIQLGSDESNRMTGEERWRGSLSPLDAYMALSGSSGYYGGLYGDSYGGTYGTYGSRWYGGSTGQLVMAGQGRESLESLRVAGTITIESLNSRFIPVPGMASYIQGSEGWLTYSDGTVYSRTGSAAQGTTYTAYATYLDPITSASGFDQVELIAAWGDTLAQESDDDGTQDWRRRSDSRQQLVDDGLADAADGWVIMPVDIDDDGTMYDASGAVVGVFQDDEPLLDADFIDAVGLGGDENLVIGRVDDRHALMALWSDDPAVSYAGRDSIEVPAPDGDEPMMLALDDTDDGNLRWASTMYIVLTLLAQGVEDFDDISTYYGGTTFSDEVVEQMREGVAQTESYVHDRYTALPDGLPQAVQAVVGQAVADGVSADADGYEEQVAAMRWLVDYFTDPANGFEYSLDAPDGDGYDNIDVIADFLEERSGYCSHYAAALAILGRALGVPTRMVLGYAPGSGSDDAGTFAVAASQLHSWTEAYIDGVGWVPFDVTPASGSATADDDAVADAVDGDAMGDVEADATEDDGDDTASNEADVETAEDDTTGADDDAEASARDAGEASRSSSNAWRSMLPWAMAAVILVVALAAVPSAVRRRRRSQRLRIIAAAGEGAQPQPHSESESESESESRLRSWPGSSQRHGRTPSPGRRQSQSQSQLGALRHRTRPSRSSRQYRLMDGESAAATIDAVGSNRQQVTAMFAGQADAWKAAWRELTDTAWDCGLRWGDAATDRDIATQINECMSHGQGTVVGSDTAISSGTLADTATVPNANTLDGYDAANQTGAPPDTAAEPTTATPPACALVWRVCEQAEAATFGGVVGGQTNVAALADGLPTALAVIESACAQRSRFPATARLRHRMFPASLFRR